MHGLNGNVDQEGDALRCGDEQADIASACQRHSSTDCLLAWDVMNALGCANM